MILAIVAIVVATLLLWAAFRLWLTARRLDRLHKRTEAAWAACAESLARRIVAARVLASTGHLAPQVAHAVRDATVAADGASREARQGPEFRLGVLLAGLDGAARSDLGGELADAEERVALAAQFYNDAVRDTRALRASWFTRFFRLAGHARLPEYFDLPVPVDTEDAVGR